MTGDSPRETGDAGVAPTGSTSGRTDAGDGQIINARLRTRGRRRRRPYGGEHRLVGLAADSHARATQASPLQSTHRRALAGDAGVAPTGSTSRGTDAGDAGVAPTERTAR